ncbi:hypothetical protein BC833DRAFT_408136 [Globomyces pollinis-pini]|nr:hypothetical protein BC833DRAFT_408136 [Globomyces pollinis-pini]
MMMKLMQRFDFLYLVNYQFLEISEAYSILGNELKRKEYDSSNIGVSGNNSTRTGDPYQRWSSRSYRETLRPDDWILYRRSNKTTRPGFDFAAHRKAHYGETVEEDLNSMKGIRRKYYQEVYEEQGWKHKFIRWGVILFVMGCIFQSEAFGLVFI